MSSIPHNTESEHEMFDSVTNFLKEFQVGTLLFQCNAGKMKGIPVMNIFRYLFCLIFLTEVCICREKQGFLKMDSVKIPFIVFSIIAKPTGCVLQLYSQQGLSTTS